MPDGPARAGPQPILELFGGYPEEVTTSTTDAELEAIAKRAAGEFADPDQMAPAILDFLRLTRKRARDLVRAEASDVGLQVVRLQQELQEKRATRNTLVDEIIGWHEEPEWDGDEPNFAQIAKLAHMSRQGARSTYSTATATGTD